MTQGWVNGWVWLIARRWGGRTLVAFLCSLRESGSARKELRRETVWLSLQETAIYSVFNKPCRKPKTEIVLTAQTEESSLYEAWSRKVDLQRALEHIWASEWASSMLLPQLYQLIKANDASGKGLVFWSLSVGFPGPVVLILMQVLV